MYYLMIIVSAFLFSTQFLLSNEFRKESGNTWNASLKFSLYSSLFGLPILIIINGFHLELSAFSVVVAFVYSIVTIALAYSSIKAFLYANLSVYSVIAMIGGMLLPFVYGVLCGETLTLARIVCCILIAVCVLMSIHKGESSKKAFKYYIAVFILNGMIGVISKFEQSHIDLCVDSGSFMVLTKVLSIVLSALLIAFQKEKNYRISIKACAYTIMHSLVNSIGNLMLLIALIHLPASVQYPMVTGGTIVFSVLISVFAKERITKKEFIGAAIAFTATLFMML